MAAVFTIGIASESKAYQQGIESGVIKPTEDAEKALKEFAKGGDKAGDAIEDAMRVAQRESDKARDDIEKTATAIEKAAKESRGFGGDAKQGMGTAENAVEEFSNEARQNLSETVSSFRGDVEDLAQIAQDILGGVVGGLGPIGMAAGAAGAAGIGIMVAKLQEAAEKAEELRQQTNELALEIIDAGGSIENVAMTDRLREWALAIRDNKEWWEVWQDSTITNLDAVENALAHTTRSGQELFDAMSGQDPAAALDTLDEFEGRIAKIDDELENLSRAETGWKEREAALLDERNALDDVTDAIREKQGWQDQAIDQARQLIDLTEATAAADEAAAAATKQREDAMSALQGELDEAIDSWSEYYDAETGATDPAAYIAAMRARMDATSNFNANVQTLDSPWV